MSVIRFVSVLIAIGIFPFSLHASIKLKLPKADSKKQRVGKTTKGAVKVSAVSKKTSARASAIGKRIPIKGKKAKKVAMLDPKVTFKVEFIKARKFLKIRDLKNTSNSLELAERALERDKAKFPRQSYMNAHLWLDLLWSRYHLYSCYAPSFMWNVKLEKVALVRKVRKQIELLETCFEHLESAAKFQGQYASGLKKVVKLSKVGNANWLTGVKNFKEILRNRVEIYKLRAARLKDRLDFYLKTGRILSKSRIKSTKPKKKSVNPKLSKTISNILSSLTSIKKRLGKNEDNIKKADLTTKQFHADLSSRHTRSYILTIAGSVALVGGLGSIGLGVLFKEWSSQASGHSIQDAQSYSSMGDTALVIGGASAAGGAVLIILGIILKPPVFERYQGAVKGHKTFSDQEDKYDEQF